MTHSIMMFPSGREIWTFETWVTVSGGAPSFTAQNVSAELVLEGADFDLKTLILRDPNLFVAGQLGKNKSEWEYVMAHSGMDEQILTSVRKWLGMVWI